MAAAIDGVFEDMAARGVTPTDDVYRAAVYCYGTLGHAARAAAVFQRMKAAGVQPSTATYSAMINAYAEAARPEQVRSGGPKQPGLEWHDACLRGAGGAAASGQHGARAQR